jgi:exosome complex component RRP4
VAPGDIIAEGDFKKKFYQNMILYKNKLLSTVLGVVEIRGEEELKISPLEGSYIPQEGDLVIGIVEEINPTYVYLDIKAPYKGVLQASEILGRPMNPLRDVLSEYVSIGDVYLARIERFDLLRDPLLTIRKEKGLGKITEGVLVEVNPTRIPRIIGRRSSMLEILTTETGCDLVVAANGRILIRKCPTSDHEEILIRAIRIIESQPYLKGLTDKIREFIAVEKVKRGLIIGSSQT